MTDEWSVPDALLLAAERLFAEAAECGDWDKCGWVMVAAEWIARAQEAVSR